jgi:hypothetical protein
MAYPIHGKNTFRPSGNPATDPPERPSVSQLEWIRIAYGLDTPDGVRAFDQRIAHLRSPKGFATEAETAHWDRIRFIQQKSPRARKRAEERQRSKENV